MDSELLLLAPSETPLFETPKTQGAANDLGSGLPVSPTIGGAAAGEISITPIKPETQIIFLKLVLQLRALKFKKTVEVESSETGAASSSTAEVWDASTGPKLADALRRKVFKEMTGSGVAGNSSDTELVDSCVVDVLRAFSKKLCQLDPLATPLFDTSKGSKKKSRKEKKRGGDDDEDEDEGNERRKEKKSKKDKKKKKDKKSKKEKKQKRSKFIDDMAGESDESDDDY